MKKQFVLWACGLFLVAVFSSCFRDHNISISVSDEEDVYRMTAKFDRSRTWAVRRYLNEHLHRHNSRSFKNSSIDGSVTLDDGTSFYMLSRPGRLKIKMDKTENSEEACAKVKDMCEDIKDILAGKYDDE